jgi:hypothetical protein
MVSKFVEEPERLIKTRKDLDNAKYTIKTFLTNEKLREKFAKFAAQRINTAFYNNKNVISGTRESGGGEGHSIDADSEEYLKYRLLGGQKSLKDYDGKKTDAYIQKGEFLKLNPKSEHAMEVASEAALASRRGYADDHGQNKARLIGAKGAFYGNTALLGGFTGNQKLVIRKNAFPQAYASYKDTWDVALHPAEKEILYKYLDGQLRPSASEFSKIIQSQNAYVESEQRGFNIGPYILRELVSSIPKAKPAVFKGVVPFNTRAADGFIPNFAGGTPNRALENAKRLLEKLKPLTGIAKTLGFDQFLGAVLPNGVSPIEQGLVEKSLEQVIPAAKAGFQDLMNRGVGVSVSTREMGAFQSILKDLIDLDAGIPLRSGSHINDPTPMIQGLVKRARIAHKQIKAQARRNIEGGAAGGFLPNFANPLQAAVGREMAAGVPASQIYIDKSPALKNAANPMGLMVANRRDEPAGGFQGISRARREGANPMTYGAAGGFVPNYAAGGSGPDVTPYVGLKPSEATVKINQGLTDNLKQIQDEYDNQEKSLKQTSESLKKRSKIERDILKKEEDLLKQIQANLAAAQAAGKKSPQAQAAITNMQMQEAQQQKAVAAAQQPLRQTLEERKQIAIQSKTLATDTANKKAEANQNAANLQTAVAQSAKRSITNPLGKVRDTSTTPGGNRDMLGTIFAVQGAMSALTGATEGATSGMAKLFNSFGAVASSVTTVVFAGQGLSQAFGGAEKGFGRVIGKLGGVAAVGVGLYVAFKEAIKYVDSNNQGMKSAAEATGRLAEAASKASVNLDNINPAIKKRFEEEARASVLAIGSKAQKLASDGEQTTGQKLMAPAFQVVAKAMGEKIDITSLRYSDLTEGLGDTLNQELYTSMANARGVGIPQTTIDELLLNYAKKGDKNKLGEVQLNGGQVKNYINELNKMMSEIPSTLSPQNLLNQIGGDNAKVLGSASYEEIQSAKSIADTMDFYEGKDLTKGSFEYDSFKDAQSRQTPESKILLNLIKSLKKEGISEEIRNEYINKTTSLAKDQEKAIAEEKIGEIARSPRELQETIKAIKREKLERESIRTIEQETAKARYDSSLLVAGIETDLTLSASDRTIKTLEAQAALEKQTAELEAQKTIQEELNKLAGEFMDKNLFKGSDAEDKVRATLKNLKDNKEAQAILSSNNQQQAAIDFAKAQLQGTDLKENITAAEQLSKAILSALDFQEKTNQAVQDGNDEKEKSKNLEIAKNKIQEQNNRLLKEAQSSVSAIADNYAMRASGIAGQLRLNSPRQELALAQYNATTQETDPRKLREDQRKIIDEFFQKQVSLQAEQSRIEAEADFIRNLKVEENIIQLNDNTKATIDNTNAIINSNRPATLATNTATPFPIDFNDSLVQEAMVSIGSSDLFKDVNDQVKNCAKVVLKFAKAMGIPTAGANDLANSFQNVGTKIDKSELKAGDFLINTRGGGPNSKGGHVGMYLGNGQVLQASQSAFDRDPNTKEQSAKVTPYIQNQWTMARRPGMSVSQATATTVGIGQQGIDQAKKLASENDATIINQKALEYARSLKIGEDNAQGLAEQIKNLAIKMREIGVEKALAGEEQRLKNMAADAQAIQERLALSDARSIKGAMERPASTFTEGMQNGFLQLEADSQDFAYILGKDIPKMFSDGMSGAINSAIEGTVSLKDGLRSAAYEFVKTINQRMMSNLVDKIVGGTGQAAMETGGTGGGGIMSFFSNMFAAGGKVTGGSGSKDDVPAMLMGGEYVVNKRAVAKYGPQFLEAINNGTLAGYAKGGKIQRGPQGNFYTPGTFGQGAIEGKRNLLDFATQTGTSGKFDQMINESGYQSISLEPESSRLSVSGMRNSPMFDATQSAKGQAFDLYLQQYNAEREAKKQEKEQKKALITQLLMLAGSAALGGIGKAAMTGGTNAVKALGQEAGFFDKAKAFFGGTYKGGDIGSGIMGGGLKNYFSGNFGLAYQSEILKALPVSRAIGGMIPSTSGIDTVPAMLSGGEFVMNRSAVQSIGTPNLQSMNAGGTSITSEETSKELNEKLLAKLDELIGSSGSTGNITINVAPSGQTSQETSQDPSASRQQLARQIKDAVLQIINDEKRIGGSLRR